LPRKVFVANEILTASDVNEFLMDQSVMVFAGTAARGSAIPSPSEGMVTYLSDSDEVEVFDGSVYKAVGPGKILQVVSTTKTDTSSASMAAGASAATGLSVSITPSSTSNKILVRVSVNMAHEATFRPALTLKRGSTAIAIAASAGSRTSVSSSGQTDDANGLLAISQEFLDSPSSTSSLTYSVDFTNVSGLTRTLYLNRAETDTDGVGTGRAVYTITLMEVAGLWILHRF
jgi:hypothetical protein